jgi:hypothetical protein
MVDKALLMGLAALNEGLQGRVVAEPWFGELPLGHLELEGCEVTTIEVPNQVPSAEDDRPAVLLHLPPETAVLPGSQGHGFRTDDSGLRMDVKGLLGPVSTRLLRAALPSKMAAASAQEAAGPVKTQRRAILRAKRTEDWNTVPGQPKKETLTLMNLEAVTSCRRRPACLGAFAAGLRQFPLLGAL